MDGPGAGLRSAGVHPRDVPGRPVLLTLRLLLWRARPLLVLAGLVLVGGVAVRHLGPAPPPTQVVVVAARDLPAGHVLTGADLTVVRMPPHAVPDGVSVSPDRLTGRAVVVAVTRGLPVVPSVLEGQRFGVPAPPGTVTVPILLADPAVARLLRPGDRLDLVAPADWDVTTAGSGEPVVLASRALVLDVVDEADAGTPLLSAAQGSAPVTVVAVSPAEGHRLAAAGWGSLGAVLVG